ncbi:hypothetical protein ACWGHM_34490 [Streptomyces sp. NPDC054904]
MRTETASVLVVADSLIDRHPRAGASPAVESALRASVAAAAIALATSSAASSTESGH